MLELPWQEVHLQGVPLTVIRGAAPLQEGILTWGDRLELWPWTGAAARLIRDRVNFQQAGSAAGGSVFLLEGSGRLVRLAWPRLTTTVIEPATACQEVLWTEMAGRSGLLYVHLHSQLRFWDGSEAQELYSIYTPSRQGGLQVVDIDEDGRSEILCGNYWLKDTGSSNRAWRLFAINTFFERETSALARIAYLKEPRGLMWASEERIVWHEPRSDLRQLWRSEPVECPGAGKPAAMLAHRGMIWLGHSRGVHLLRRMGGRWTARHYTRDINCVALLEKNDGIWAVSEENPRPIYPLR